MNTSLRQNLGATKALRKLISISPVIRPIAMNLDAKLTSIVCVFLLLVLSIVPATLSLLSISVSIQTSGEISDQSMLPLHTVGPDIKDSSDRTIYLRGVNYPSGFTASCTGCFPADNDWLWGACYTSLSSSSLNGRLSEMQSYGFTAVRLIFNPDWWRSNAATNLNGQTTSIHIREAILQVIQAAQDYGIYVIICPWSSNFDPLSVFGSQANFVTMWTQAAQMYGNEPNVIFELFNEPNGNYNSILDAFEAATAAIRQYTSNIVVVQYGYCGSFGYVDDFAPVLETYGNIVYSNHIYRYPPGATMSTSVTTKAQIESNLMDSWSYDSVVGRYPMYIGEIGAWIDYGSGETTWFGNALSLLNDWGASYTAWEWGQDGTNWQLSTPTTAPWSPNSNGQALRNAIIAGSS